MKNITKKISIIFIGLMLLSLLLPPTIAAPILFQYVYDKNGQLIKSIDSTAIVIEYIYDEVGNRTEVKRDIVEGLAIVGFSPTRGPIGQQVILQTLLIHLKSFPRQQSSLLNPLHWHQKNSNRSPLGTSR